MRERVEFSLRDAYARELVETAKQSPEKFKKKIFKAEAAIDSYRSAYDTEQRKSLLYDMLYCNFCFGASGDDYFLYDFEHLSNEKRDQFVTDKVRLWFYQSVNELSGVKLLNDKFDAYLRFQKHYHRDVMKVCSIADLPAFIEFASKHPKFIAKPNNLYGGIGVCIYDTQETTIFDIFEQLINQKDGVVIEELLMQSDDMNRLNDSCLNTVRIVTAYFADEVEIHFTSMRCGRNGSQIDNFCSGGLSTLIDAQSGRVITPFADRNRNFYDRHPDSGMETKSFRLPQWDEACALVKELAALIPECRVVGWDLAHTKDGWVMIEGNGCPQLGAQIVSEGWIAPFEDLQKRLIEEMGEPCHWEE